MADTTRVLDLDLDFFVHGVEFWPAGERADSEYFKPWSLDAALDFLEDVCGLSGRLPGFVVTNHGELFPLWREAIRLGQLDAPFHVTHVDAHADLGLGDAGFKQIMTDLLFRPPEERLHPHDGAYGISDANWLSYAVACRWITDVTYVYCEGGGDDVLHLHMENFDRKAPHLQLKAVTSEDLDRMPGGGRPRLVQCVEPKVPLRQVPWGRFRAEASFDVVCLAQSPPYTPVEADSLFAEIRTRFIDGDALR